MLFPIFLIYTHCFIPEQFRSLVDKVILNSTFKVPKNLREDTKYPGNYSFGNARFTLYEVVSSSQTKDLKAYAVENHYAAIVKRKKFNLKNGFILIDYNNNEFYKMEKVVASDDKINIYKATQVDIFNVMSDIEAKVQTPEVGLEGKYLWDEKRNRPELQTVGSVSVGAGFLFSAKVHSKVKFHSLKKAEINTDITLTGKIGVEFSSKKGDYQLPDIQPFADNEIMIDAISFKFLGLHFDFGVYLTFGAMLKDLQKKLDVDIDYFKSYQISAKRFISIKRHGTLDSGWQTEISPIPPGTIVEGTSNNLQSNFITGAIQLKSGIKIKADIFRIIQSSFSFGIIKQFMIDFSFKPLVCPYPYLYGQFEFPLLSYYDFSGIILRIKLFGRKKNYKLLKPHYEENYQFSLFKTRKYCLYDPSNINDYAISTNIDNFDGSGDDNFINETSNKYISIDVKNIINQAHTKTPISLQISLKEINLSTKTDVQLYNRRISSYEDISTKNSDFDTTIVESRQNRLSSNILLYFWYISSTNTAEKSKDLSFYLREYLIRNDSFLTLPISNQMNTERISVDLRVKYCENLTLHQMYVPSSSVAVFEGDSLNYGEKFCVIVKDLNENNTDYVDENASYITDGTLSNSLEDRGVYTHNDEFFLIHIDRISLPSSPDPGSSVRYELGAEYGNNYERKSLLISNFSQNIQKGDNIISDNFKPKVRFTKNMRLYILVTYNQNYSTIGLYQKITYSEIQQIAKLNIMKLNKTQLRTKISCGISIKRYTPVIRVNCSTKNSTHRVLTQVYTLKSAKPSESKPSVIHLEEGQYYGVFEIKKIYPRVKNVIIHMPFLQPLCHFTMLSDDYFQFEFDKDTIYIPFRRENSTIEDLTIENVIQGNFIDEEKFFFSEEFYNVNFDEKPVALALVRTFNNQYSITGIEHTKQTLVNYSDPSFQILALEYDKNKTILVSPSLIIIDDKHPLVEKAIPKFPNWKTVTYHVWCERADEILIHDKTDNITTENNIERDCVFFKITVQTGHLIDFIPICTSNITQPMCYIRQTFSNNNSYAIIRHPNKDGITKLNASLDNIFEQEDRQGLIEEVIKTEKLFYYMTSSSEQVQIIRTYDNKLDLQLRIIEVKDKYKKFCVIDPDGFIVPVSRSYYSDHYNKFLIELGIEYNDPQYLDFVSGENDSCVYAIYNSSNYSEYQDEFINDTEVNDTYYSEINMSWDSETSTDLMLLSKNSKLALKPSNNICDLAKSLKVVYYDDIKQLIPPENFDYDMCTIQKRFDESLKHNVKMINYEILEYFIKIKLMVEPKTNNSIYVLDFPFNEITFNTTLKEDEYIKASDNFTVHYLGGILNYILLENAHTIIDLGDKNEINLNLIGKETFEIKTSEKTTLKIKGKLNLDSIQTFYVDNDVKNIEIESVNVANYSELYVKTLNNDSVSVKINKLTLLAHSTANFTNIEVTDTLIIKQTATAIFDNTVVVKNAELFIEMIAYQNDLIPMIKGSLHEPPRSINIHRISDNAGPKKNDEYMIFDGQFDCQAWVNRISFGNSYFNTIRCSNHNYNEVRILETEESRAFISYVKQPPVEKEEYYIPVGLVAIIVFSVLDIGLIIFLSFFLIRIKFGNKDHSHRLDSMSTILEPLDEKSDNASNENLYYY